MRRNLNNEIACQARKGISNNKAPAHAFRYFGTRGNPVGVHEGLHICADKPASANGTEDLNGNL